MTDSSRRHTNEGFPSLRLFSRSKPNFQNGEKPLQNASLIAIELSDRFFLFLVHKRIQA